MSTAARRRRLPRLRTVLLLINLVVLVLPVGGIFALRIYESALIRQTESELIAQAAVIATVYEHDYAEHPAADPHYGLPLSWQAPEPGDDGPWRPHSAGLDLATDTVLPPAAPPAPAPAPADVLALSIGRELTPILHDAQRSTLAGIRVVDYNGVVVASTNEELGLSVRDREEVARALSGEPVSLLRQRGETTPPPPLDSISRGAHVHVVVAEPIVADGRVLGAVVVVRTPANIRQALWGKRQALLRAGLLLLVLVLALSLFTSLTISRPVNDLIRQARRAARGERGAVTPLTSAGTSEIQELSETIASMAATLESRAAYIRDFAAHVSHEFKTPLTSLQGSVELLREHGEGMSRADRERFLDILAADAGRLERLVRRLLDLARADVLQPAGENCELGGVVQAVAARCRERGLVVTVEGADAPLPVPMAADILDSILGTLCENARQHGGTGVKVMMRAAIERGRVALTVADDGRGISSANAAKIFEPFFTTAREHGGTGLGLAIARALLRAHGGDIGLLRVPHGASFQISLPLATQVPAHPE
jgi:signal transduction histidine kinase